MNKDAIRVRYRILERLAEGRRVGLGVAYEKDDLVLFFVPGWRGARKLSVGSLEDVQEVHFHQLLRLPEPNLQSDKLNWCSIQEWTDKTPFQPLSALKLHAPALENTSHNMPKELEPHNEIERRTPRPRPLWQSPGVAVICALIAVAATLFIFWKVANPPLPPVSPGNPAFIRDVYIMLDPTGSMTADLEEAKRFIIERIFPLLGPGDHVFCYNVGPDFVETRSRVFGQKQLPGVPENMLNAQIAGRIPAENLNALLQQAQDVIEQDWTKRLNEVSGPVDRQPGSNYIEAFSYIATRLNPQKGQHSREKWLIVIGDLLQEPAPDPFRPPEPTAEEAEAFNGVQVRLFYPYRAQRSEQAQAKKQRRRQGQKQIRPGDLKEFWTEYFLRRGTDQFLMMTFDDLTPPLPQSPVPNGGK
ncbi:MAG TPA: hypothetical protein VF762_13810 [Blastocatellia bacterium]